jgi:hypothetical protein
MEDEDRSKLLEKLNELNAKLGKLHKTGGVYGTDSAIEPVSLDFINSDNLQEIERGIRHTIQGVVLSKAAVCKSLANIDRKKLYRQAGADNFMQYLEEERIPIKYKTAKEYAKIGDVLIRHEEELDTVDFTEEDGLKKLMYLDRALEQTEEDREQVYQKVKEYSLRDFKQFALHTVHGGEDETTGIDKTVPMHDTIRIVGRRILLSGSESHPVTLINAEGVEQGGIDPQLIESFMRELYTLTRAYIKRSRDKEEEGK